jgi:hypothetical protein
MVQRITCSADNISRLTNSQIEFIIDQVKSKMTASDHWSGVNETSKNMSTLQLITLSQMIILATHQMLQFILMRRF